MVVLVPRQIRMTGMTGDVPYYGGRLTPAQAYAASHRSAPPPPPLPVPSPPTPAAPPPSAAARDPLPALQDLLDSGVITPDEFQELLARVKR